jgi:hypothetical protein
VHHEVGAERDRPLEVRSREAIVHDERYAARTGQPAQPLEVDQVEARVGGRLDEEQPGLLAEQALEALGLRDVGVVEGDAPAGKEPGQDLVGGAEEGAGGEDVVAGLEQRRHRDVDRRHAAGGRDAVLGPLEETELAGQFVGVGVGIPAVDVAGNLVGEQRPGLLRAVEHEARGEVERHRVLALGAGRNLGPNGQGLRVQGTIAHRCSLPPPAVENQTNGGR